MIPHAALRRGPNGRPAAGAYAISAREAVDLAIPLSRQVQRLFDSAPNLHAKGVARVIEMLLADDCVAPARTASRAKLSDPVARRLFDRLIELNVVRELSGRSSFRLYGL